MKRSEALALIEERLTCFKSIAQIARPEIEAEIILKMLENAGMVAINKKLDLAPSNGMQYAAVPNLDWEPEDA